MLKVLAFDPAKNTGMAYFRGTQCSQLIQTFNYGFELKERSGTELLGFHRHLKQFLPLNYIAYEQVQMRHQSTRAAEIYWSIVTSINIFSAQYKVKIIKCPVKTVKKYASGNGNADKHIMVAAANQTFKSHLPEELTIKQHDIADALGILHYAVQGILNMEIK